jgi:hypothetical protein
MTTRIDRPRLSRSITLASAALTAALLSSVAQAVPQRLSVIATAGAGNVACSATTASISRTPPLRLSFTCANSAVRFRCELVGSASYTLANNQIAAACFALTEVPAGNPSELDFIFAAGGEG